MLHKAYDLLRPGDVLVVDGGGDLNQALVGEIMMTRAKAMGVAGFVIDGAVRDVAAFAEAGFPCFRAVSRIAVPTNQVPERSTCRSRSTAWW